MKPHLRPRWSCPPGSIYLTDELAPRGEHRRVVVTYNPTTTAKLAYQSAQRLEPKRIPS